MYERSDYVTAAGLGVLDDWNVVIFHTRLFLARTVA